MVHLYCIYYPDENNFHTMNSPEPEGMACFRHEKNAHEWIAALNTLGDAVDAIPRRMPLDEIVYETKKREGCVSLWGINELEIIYI